MPQPNVPPFDLWLAKWIDALKRRSSPLISAKSLQIDGCTVIDITVFSLVLVLYERLAPIECSHRLLITDTLFPVRRFLYVMPVDQPEFLFLPSGILADTVWDN